jgi:WD40 repeat protein
LICVGTEGGAVYVYGDGFQFVRTWLIDDPNEVVSIVPLHPNKILVAYADNSLVVLELPTLEVIDLLPTTWLTANDGDLTSIHCDLPNEKNLVFCGTSAGNLFVLDVMESAIRICEYNLTTADFGLSGPIAISDIQMSPKSERFLAVSCEGPTISSGNIVVFDLEKHKLHKTFKSFAVSTLMWHHSGDVLFAGTRNGLLYSINVEKGSIVESWNAQSELIGDDGDDNDDEPPLVTIRKLNWLAPQTTSASDTGCLFALLSTFSVSCCCRCHSIELVSYSFAAFYFSDHLCGQRQSPERHRRLFTCPW